MFAGGPSSSTSGRNVSCSCRNGPLDLALAFRVTRLARRDLRAVMSGEPDRRRVQHEPRALRRAERAHPVGATHRRDTTGGVEEPDEAFEGVLAVLGWS